MKMTHQWMVSEIPSVGRCASVCCSLCTSRRCGPALPVELMQAIWSWHFPLDMGQFHTGCGHLVVDKLAARGRSMEGERRLARVEAAGEDRDLGSEATYYGAWPRVGGKSGNEQPCGRPGGQAPTGGRNSTGKFANYGCQ